MTAATGFELERGFRRSLPRALARWPVFRIAHTSAALEALVEAALEPAGLDRRSFAALLVLADLGPLKQSALAQRLGVDRTTMVSIARLLSEEGLIRRSPSVLDGRALDLALRPPGAAALQQAGSAAQSAHATFLRPLARPERLTFARHLEELEPLERSFWRDFLLG